MSFTFSVVCDKAKQVVDAKTQETIRALGEKHNLQPTRMTTAGVDWLLVGQREDYVAFLSDLGREQHIRIIETAPAW